jgi:hypothetical protein
MSESKVYPSECFSLNRFCFSTVSDEMPIKRSTCVLSAFVKIGLALRSRKLQASFVHPDGQQTHLR